MLEAPERPSQRMRADSPDPDSQDSTPATSPLDVRIDARIERHDTRKFRRLAKASWSALAAGIAALIGVVGGMIMRAEADGAQKQLLRYLETEVSKIRDAREAELAADREAERKRRRVDEQPDRPPSWIWRLPSATTGASSVDPVPRPAAPTTPASKGPQP